MTAPNTLDLAGLLPCPFCGGHADDDNDHNGQWIECQVCAARSMKVRYSSSEHRAAWNLRAQIQADAEELARLREVLASIADFAVGYGDVCEIIASRARAALLGIAP